MGLTINCRKTKTLAGMPSSSCPQPQPILHCSSEDLVKPVSAFHYLGSTVSQDCITVLRCHPGLSKPRRHLALSTEGCGCIRRSRMSLSSVSSLPHHQCFCPKRPWHMTSHHNLLLLGWYHSWRAAVWMDGVWCVVSVCVCVYVCACQKKRGAPRCESGKLWVKLE